METVFLWTTAPARTAAKPSARGNESQAAVKHGKPRVGARIRANRVSNQKLKQENVPQRLWSRSVAL